MSAAASSTVPPATDMLEERLIDAEYKIWKKNTPFLYDFVLTHSLEWPSLTAQWLPVQKQLTKGAVQHELLLGTHTTGEQNYLMVATCVLPADAQVLAESTTASSNGDNDNNNNTATAAGPPPRYDDERKELGGYGGAGSDVGKIEIRMKIKHEGEVNRARYMPQNHFIVATRGPSKELYIWDFSKHTSFPADNSPFCPQGVLLGHKEEGYAMAWAPHKEGNLLTGSDDATVKLWDVRAAYAKGAATGTQIKPLLSLEAHAATVEDVAWHARDAHMAGSVGDDRRLCLWDVRDASQTVQTVEKAHGSDINCLAFNPENEYTLATGSADASIHIWDIRKMDTGPLSKLLGHNDQVFKLEWSPENEAILGSCSADRRVGLWDLSRIGREQSPEDAEDGPPELLFLHGGHTSKVSDFSWLPGDWTIASVSEDNVLQVWNPAEEIYAEDDEEDDGNEEDGVVEEEDLE